MEARKLVPVVLLLVAAIESQRTKPQDGSIVVTELLKNPEVIETVIELIVAEPPAVEKQPELGCAPQEEQPQRTERRGLFRRRR